MKKRACILMFICLCGFLNAQVPFSLEDPQMDAYFSNSANVPVIKGKLLNCTAADLDTLSIRYVLVVPNPERQSTRNVLINKDGSFEIKLDYAIPYQQLFLMLPHNNFSEIIAHKGLFIEADLEQFRNVSLKYKNQEDSISQHQKINFSGPDASINQMKKLYNNFEPEVKNEFYSLLNEARNWKLSRQERLNVLTRANGIMEAIEKRFIAKHPFKEAWILENERKSEYYGYQFVIHWQHGIPKGDTLQAALLHQPLLLSNNGRAYYTYLHNLLSIKNKMDVLKGLSEVSISPIKADLVKIIGGPEDLYEREEYMGRILPGMETAWCKKLLQDELANKKMQTEKINTTLQNMPLAAAKTSLGKFVGSPSKGVNLYTSKESNIDSLVQRIRALYPNQAIILDVWATWCAPCISDMKNSKETKEELKKLPVKVVYLCVTNNSDEEKWKKKVAELGVDGDHIWLTGDLSARIMERYGLSGYPSYIFIDAKGEYHPKFINSIQHLDIENLKKKL